MEQDPAGKSPYVYVKGVDYVNQVVEDSPNLLPGVGVLIDPGRLRGSAIEKRNPYYVPVFGMRIYGKNPEDVINIAGKIDEKYFKPKSTFTLKREQSTAILGEDPQPVKKNSFFTRAAKGASSLGQRAAQGAKSLGQRAAQGARAAAAAAGKAGTYVKNKTMSLRSPRTKQSLTSDEITAKKAQGKNTRNKRAAAKANNVNVQGFASNNSNLFGNANAPAAVPVTKPAKKGKKPPPSQEAIAAAQAAKKAKRNQEAANNAARGPLNMTGDRRELSSNLFQGGSRKMRKPKRGARTFRKRRS